MDIVKDAELERTLVFTRNSSKLAIDFEVCDRNNRRRLIGGRAIGSPYRSSNPICAYRSRGHASQDSIHPDDRCRAKRPARKFSPRLPRYSCLAERENLALRNTV